MAGCAWIALNAHFVSLDTGLAAWLTVALLGLVGCIEDRGRGSSTLAWVGMAGAFMSKGLIGIVIPGAAMVLAAAWMRQPSLLWRLRWWPGVLVFALMVLPWLALMEARNPGFLEFFFIREHFQRFTSEVHARVEPWWYFGPVFLLGALPWLGHWVVLAFERSARKDPVDTLLLAWAGFVILFFSLSGSKLPSYILPMFPALALWLGRRVHLLSDRALGWALGAPSLAAVTIAAASVPLLRNADRGESVALAQGYLPWILAAVALALLAVAVAWRWRSPATRLRGLATLSLATLAAAQCLQWGHAVMGERHSARGLVERLRLAEGDAPFDPSIPFFAVGTWDQSLPFYLGRTLRLVDWRDEMDMGLRQEPHLNGPSTQALQGQWTSLERAYAIVDLDTLARWQAQGIALREVARTPRRAVIAPNRRQ